MNILAIETANFSGSLALKSQGQIVDFYSFEHPHTLGAQLIPQIELLLKRASLKLQDLDLLCATKGPGSFTGVRIGLGTLRGLHLATGIPMLALNSFEWVAQSFLGTHSLTSPLAVALDAHLEEVFCQVFDETGKAFRDPVSLKPQEIEAYLPEKVTVVGNGALQIEKHSSKTSFTYNPQMPDARDLAHLAEGFFPRRTEETFAAVPFYLKEAAISEGKPLETFFSLQELALEHADLLAMIHQASYPCPWEAKAFGELLTQAGSFGYLIKDHSRHKAVGFVLARRMVDEAEILAISVLPEYQKKGCGTLLMRSLISFLESSKAVKLFLEVSKENQAALNLYKKFDFIQVGYRKQYYTQKGLSSSDAFVLERALNKKINIS